PADDPSGYIPLLSFHVTVIPIVPPFFSTSAYIDSWSPSPSEIMTTIEAVPITTPRTVRKVRNFLRLRLLMLILSKSLHLIKHLLLFRFTDFFLSVLYENHGACRCSCNDCQRSEERRVGKEDRLTRVKAR